MEKENVKSENREYTKDRFSFELRINDNMICQRYFRINGFNYRSLQSEELIETLNYCVNLIKQDLDEKTKSFLINTAPQVYDNVEEMSHYVSLDTLHYTGNGEEYYGGSHLEVPSYAILRDSESVYVWDGTKYSLYEGRFNRNDYLKDDNTPYVLKFVFLDGENEVHSISWDASVYPRFVRMNIDLSNSKNRYRSDMNRYQTIDEQKKNNFSPYEAAIIDLLNEGRKDLIPVIMNEISTCCSMSHEDYNRTLNYGKRQYTTRPGDVWDNYVASAERKCKKKTDKYFANLY